MRVKELPRRVQGQPVVKALFLGWNDAEGGRGYEAFVVTVNEASPEDAPVFRAHLLNAAGMDKSWGSRQMWPDLRKGNADSLFQEFAQRPGWLERSAG